MSSWLERTVADVLHTALGSFVKGLDRGLKLSVWEGEVRLAGLELRTEGAVQLLEAM